MIKKGIIDFIYDEKDCENIRSLYKDEGLKLSLQKTIGHKIITDNSKIIDGNALDILCMICLNQDFTDNEEECFAIAVFVLRGMKMISNTFPSVAENRGLDLASKTLVSLSLFQPAMIARWKRYGTPKPEYYRKISQAEFVRHNHISIANHHKDWEHFLFQHLI